MSEATYQVYFTSENGERECLNENFYLQDEAQEVVTTLIDKGFDDATYERFTFDIGLP